MPGLYCYAGCIFYLPVADKAKIKKMIRSIFPQFNEYSLLPEEIEGLSTARFYGRDQVIVERGSRMGGVYMILHGRVKIYRENKNGENCVTGYLYAGETFGASENDANADLTKIAHLSFAAAEFTQILRMSYSNKDLLIKKYCKWKDYIHSSVNKQHFFHLHIATVAIEKNVQA